MSFTLAFKEDEWFFISGSVLKQGMEMAERYFIRTKDFQTFTNCYFSREVPEEVQQYLRKNRLRLLLNIKGF